MSKFCPNCGAQIDDDGVFCPSAKSPKEDSVIETPVPVVKKRLSRKQLLIGGGILTAVIGAVLALVLLIAGFVTPINHYIAIYKGDFSKIEAMAPDEYWTYKVQQNNTSKSQYLQEFIEGYKERYATALEETHGKILQVSWKLLHIKKADEGVTEGVANALAKNCDIDAGKVKRVYDVILKFTIKGTDFSNVCAETCAVVQIGSDWYLMRYTESEGSYAAHFVIPVDILSTHARAI